MDSINKISALMDMGLAYITTVGDWKYVCFDYTALCARNADLAKVYEQSPPPREYPYIPLRHPSDCVLWTPLDYGQQAPWGCGRAVPDNMAYIMHKI